VGADPTSLMRFEADDMVTLVAAWSAADADFPIGARRTVDDELRSLRDGTFTTSSRSAPSAARPAAAPWSPPPSP
jgi:hypothetical protein